MALSWRSICYSLFRLSYFIINNFYAVPTYFLWLLFLLPLKFINPDVYWKIESKMFQCLLAFVACWQSTGGYEIIEYGEDVSSLCEEECLVISNHQSTADVPILMQSFTDKYKAAPHIMWIMDYIFKFTNFGAVSTLRGDIFIKQGKPYREEQLKLIRRQILADYWSRKRKWLVLFPEGGFLYKRKANSQKFAKQRNLPHLRYVTLPRVGAMEVILNAMTDRVKQHNGSQNGIKNNNSIPGKPLKWLIDITIGYPDNKDLNIITLMLTSRPPCITSIYYRKYSIDDIPAGTEKLTSWMYDRFVEKEKLLEYYHQHGRFPDDVPQSHETSIMRDKPLKLEFNYLVFTGLHLVFITSLYFHYLWVSTLFKALI